MSQVIIGMDPHKRSATIEVMTADEAVVGGGRYGTDASGRAAMLAGVRRWPERTWAVEGSRGVGRQLASWLAGAGEQVVDVPPKLSARTRVFTAGQGRKTGRRMRPAEGEEKLALRRRGKRRTRGHPARQATPVPPIGAHPLPRRESKQWERGG